MAVHSRRSRFAAPLKTAGHVLARNTVLNLLGGGTSLGVAAIAMPAVVRGLGTERFGVLAIGWVVLGFFNVVDLGIGRASTKFIASALGSGKGEEVPAIAWTAAGVQLGLSALGAALLAGLTPFLVDHALKVPVDIRSEVATSFRVLAISLPAVLLSGTFRGILEGAQRFDIVNGVRVPLSAANFLLPLVALWIGWGLPGVMGLLVLSRYLGLAVHYLACLRLFPSLGLPARGETARLQTLLSYGSWITVSSLVAPLLVQADRFVIGAYMSLAAVGFYSAPYEAVTRLWLVPSSLVSTLFPAVSGMSAVREHERVAKMVAQSLKFLLISMGFITLVVVLFASDGLRWWLGADFQRESTLALQILAAGVFVNSMAFVPMTAIQAFGRPDIAAKFHLVELPIHLTLMWVLVRVWGIPGAACAWTARACLDATLLFAAAWKLNAVSVTALRQARIVQAAMSTAMFGGATFALALTGISPGLQLGGVLLAAAIALGIAWHTALDADFRSRISRLLARTE